MNRKIINLAVGKPKEFNWNNKKELSSIGKSCVQAVELKKSGFVGDDVANHKFHGGPDRAVCLYPFEHYSYWEEIFQKKLILPAFGENITASGMVEEQVCIGDIYKIGDTIVQVAQGRVPCATISNYNQENQFLKKVVETTLTGYFFRVLEEGTIMFDSEITLVEKHAKEISVSFATQILFHQQQDKTSIEKILTVDALAEDWKNRFLKLL
ncbi:MOSC domain-containing protein [Neobacillus drentensis]|uniref:MOSC domain-containing protein n=1 Tax=Neobacillus drentensis TaxID=220684 RepID=UPI001F3BF741|nr:MOSC domain-containing protein [Neobacillus drentensis]ULT54833.1 MOSC domain-containing protein [Neobacillus drentensis]